MTDVRNWLRSHAWDVGLILAVVAGIVAFSHLKGRLDELKLQNSDPLHDQYTMWTARLLEAQYYVVKRNDQEANLLLDDIERNCPNTDLKLFAYELHCRLYAMWSKDDHEMRRRNMTSVLKLVEHMKRLDPGKKRYNPYHWEAVAHIFLYSDTKIPDELAKARKAVDQSLEIWPQQTKDAFNLAEVQILAGQCVDATKGLQALAQLNDQLSTIDLIVRDFLLGLAEVLDESPSDPHFDDCLVHLKRFQKTDPDIYVTTELAAHVRSMTTLTPEKRVKAEALVSEMQRICREGSFKETS